MDETELVTTQQMLDLGMSARQLHHWSTCEGKYLRAVDANPGSGAHRVYPPGELEVARRMLALIEVGFNVAQAAAHARHPDRWVLVAAAGDSPMTTAVEEVLFRGLQEFNWLDYSGVGPTSTEWARDLSRKLSESLRLELGL